VTAFGLGSLITSPFAGRLADKVGALPILRVSLFRERSVGIRAGLGAWIRSADRRDILVGDGDRRLPAREASPPSHLVTPEKRKPARSRCIDWRSMPA
jgi:MFS family permease